MARYKVILSYDGTAFKGMQRQAKARTVQGVVENSLRQIGWDAKTIYAAGRTDSGVHASGQVIAFDLDWNHTTEDLLNALNAVLERDVAVQQVDKVPDDFHPRFDAVERRYRYDLFCQPQRDPLRERYSWRVWPAVELKSLQSAAKALVGEHDYAAFGAPPKEDGPTTRNVFSAGWRQDAGTLTFEVAANAYLYHMVRRMVSIQVQVAQGKYPPETIAQYLKGDLAGMIQGLAPPQGLFLTEVRYPQN